MNQKSEKTLDLFELGDQNAKNLESQYRKIKKEHAIETGGIFERFTDFIEKNWSVSINLKQSEINSFLISGAYRNMYGIIDEDLNELRSAHDADISREEAAKNRMGIYYGKRKIFEDHFKNSDRFIYAAFNTGGPGLKKYGDFCLIIHRKEVETFCSCTFLKKESISYVSDNTLNVGRLKRDTAGRKSIHFLTAVKHEKEIADTPEKKWPKMICSEKSYIEAVTADEISIGQIDALRLSKDSYEQYYNYLYKLYSYQLEESEKIYLRTFKDMLKLLEKNRINKEIIDESGT